MSDPYKERAEWRQRPVNEPLAKTLKWVSVVLSIAVLGLVMMMRKVKIDLPEGVDFSFLPPIHAAVNAVAAVVLIAAVVAIAKGKVELHRKLMLSALGLSVLFLLSYVLYHFTTPETLFGDANGDGEVSAEEREEVGLWRSVYLGILIPHILLAAVSFPFILLTAAAAFTNDFAKHRRLARFVFPMWLFVAITGPICYLLLRPYY